MALISPRRGRNHFQFGAAAARRNQQRFLATGQAHDPLSAIRGGGVGGRGGQSGSGYRAAPQRQPRPSFEEYFSSRSGDAGGAAAAAGGRRFNTDNLPPAWRNNANQGRRAVQGGRSGGQYNSGIGHHAYLGGGGGYQPYQPPAYQPYQPPSTYTPPAASTYGGGLGGILGGLFSGGGFNLGNFLSGLGANASSAPGGAPDILTTSSDEKDHPPEVDQPDLDDVTAEEELRKKIAGEYTYDEETGKYVNNTTGIEVSEDFYNTHIENEVGKLKKEQEYDTQEERDEREALIREIGKYEGLTDEEIEERINDPNDKTDLDYYRKDRDSAKKAYEEKTPGTSPPTTDVGTNPAYPPSNPGVPGIPGTPPGYGPNIPETSDNPYIRDPVDQGSPWGHGYTNAQGNRFRRGGNIPILSSLVDGYLPEVRAPSTRYNFAGQYTDSSGLYQSGLPGLRTAPSRSSFGGGSIGGFGLNALTSSLLAGARPGSSIFSPASQPRARTSVPSTALGFTSSSSILGRGNRPSIAEALGRTHRQGGRRQFNSFFGF